MSPRRFHIAHIVHPTVHTTMGYREIVETLQWGLAQLGHDVTAATGRLAGDRTNIVVGGQMLSPADLERLPPETIFYHLEQIARVDPGSLRQSARIMTAKFHVWDYSHANLDVWRQLKPLHEPVFVPIAWGANLRRIPQAGEDIDILFYGIPTPSRFAIFVSLCNTMAKCVYACGLYGATRDSLIARSKIVLNVNAYERSRVFEVARVSYLLANEKAVVSDIYPESEIEADLRDAVAFAAPDKVAGECVRLLNDDSARRALAVLGREIFERRDIRAVLQLALAAS
jgi:hypothetical protein